MKAQVDLCCSRLRPSSDKTCVDSWSKLRSVQVGRELICMSRLQGTYTQRGTNRPACLDRRWLPMPSAQCCTQRHGWRFLKSGGPESEIYVYTDGIHIRGASFGIELSELFKLETDSCEPLGKPFTCAYLVTVRLQVRIWAVPSTASKTPHGLREPERQIRVPQIQLGIRSIELTPQCRVFRRENRTFVVRSRLGSDLFRSRSSADLCHIVCIPGLAQHVGKEETARCT